MSDCACSQWASDFNQFLGKTLKNASSRSDAWIADALEGLDQLEPRARTFKLANRAIDAIGAGGSPVLPVQQYLIDTIDIANRIVSFVLDGKIHIGTGILVGPSSVLTAAHLFFEADRHLIDRDRAARMQVEAHTTLVGNFVAEGDLSTSGLEDPCGTGWLIEPQLVGDRANREVENLDFAIVRLKKPLGNDYAGEDAAGRRNRGWIDIPTAANVEVLSSDSPIRVFQYLDREELLFSAGMVGNIVAGGFRVLHTASTAQSASGALIANARSKFVAMHLAGSATGERPKFNRGLPVRRIAEHLDQNPAIRALIAPDPA